MAGEGAMWLVPVLVDSIRVNRLEHTGHRAVVLREAEGERQLMIVIGQAEADAIGVHMRGKALPRPLSHDLMKSLLEATGTRVEQVAITRLEGETYYATITLHRLRGRTVEVDARPSDAISLALRAGAPICVAEDVMAKAGHVQDKGANDGGKDEPPG